MRKKGKIANEKIVPIISDGAIATNGTADGRAIPVLILDCKNHKSLLNHIYLHQNTLPGDVISKWGANKQSAYLMLNFSRPTELDVVLKFNIGKQGNLIDGIMRSQGVYLQPSESGLKVSEGMSNPKIIIEVPLATKLPDWDKTFLKAITQRMKHEGGMSRKIAHEAATEYISKMREMWAIRS